MADESVIRDGTVDATQYTNAGEAITPRRDGDTDRVRFRNCCSNACGFGFVTVTTLVRRRRRLARAFGCCSIGAGAGACAGRGGRRGGRAAGRGCGGGVVGDGCYVLFLFRVVAEAAPIAGARRAPAVPLRPSRWSPVSLPAEGVVPLRGVFFGTRPRKEYVQRPENVRAGRRRW